MLRTLGTDSNSGPEKHQGQHAAANEEEISLTGLLLNISRFVILMITEDRNMWHAAACGHGQIRDSLIQVALPEPGDQECLSSCVCVLACSGKANEGRFDQEAAKREEERSGGGEPGGSRAAEEAQRVRGQVYLP